ncbi:unnamed protein product [Mytilus coruscus]|uniref:Uncharacterized protein n=1 Tax=Mytilus coruscus TaxID=42192 RepID=A0A6J8A769_MYTCO|nr:unnamed protein product [Mytilus coruscus]
MSNADLFSLLKTYMDTRLSGIETSLTDTTHTLEKKPATLRTKKKIRAADTRAVKKLKSVKSADKKQNVRKRPAEASGSTSQTAHNAIPVSVSMPPFSREQTWLRKPGQKVQGKEICVSGVDYLDIGHPTAKKTPRLDLELPEELRKDFSAHTDTLQISLTGGFLFRDVGLQKLNGVYSVSLDDSFGATWPVDTTGTIEAACYAIKWAHSLAGFEDPCASDIVKCIVEASKRKFNRPIQKKEPMNANIMLSLFKKFGGFLRYSELCQIKAKNITFGDDHIDIYIESSKTDCYRKGKNVLIAKLDQAHCPVKILSDYLDKAKIDRSSDDFVFRALSYCKSTNNCKLRKKRIYNYLILGLERL